MRKMETYNIFVENNGKIINSTCTDYSLPTILKDYINTGGKFFLVYKGLEDLRVIKE